MTIRSYQFQVQALITPSGGVDVTRSVTHASVVTDEAYVGFQVDTSQTIPLVDFAVFQFLPFDGFQVVDTLDLDQTAHAFGFETVEQDLGVDHVVDVQAPIVENEVDPLGLVQDVQFGFKIKNESLTDDLGISDNVGIAIPLSVTQNLSLVQLGNWINLEDALGLTDLAEWGYGFDVEDDVDLTQQAEKIQELRKSVTDSGVVSQAAAWYIENRCSRLQFKTYHGTGGVAPQEAKLNYKSTFLFQSLKDGEVVELRNPTTDDRRRYSFNRTNRTFFDNSLDLYADPTWVTENRQIYTIEAVKRADLDTLFTFLQSNLGLEILIKDWRGVTWRAVVLNPGEVYTEDAEGYWTLDFEVVGDALDGEFVFDNFVLTDDLSRAGSIWTRSTSDTMSIVDRANRHYNESVPDDLTGLAGAATFTIVGP